MRRVGTITTASIAAATIACGGGQPSGGGGAAAAGGAVITSVARTTVTGCLETDERAGGYILRTTDEHSGRTAEAEGTTGERSPGSSFRTTGQGGDAIANSPTIGSHTSIGQAYVVAPENDSLNILQNVGKRVAINGVIYGGNVLRAESIRTVADDCATQSSGR